MKWNQPALVLTGIVLVSIVCYANTLPNAVFTDDLALVEHHPSLETPLEIVSLVSSGGWGGNLHLYRPFTLWTFTLDHRLNRALGLPGGHPAVSHLTNLLLHALIGCGLYLLLRRLTRQPDVPAFGAFLFAAHPIHTEAVATLAGRAELLAAAFGLLFLLLHRNDRPLAAAPCYALALLSKESGLAYLALAIWIDICFRRPGSTALPRGRWALYGALLGGWLALRARALGGSPNAIPFIDNPLVGSTLAERLLTAARVQLDYLRLQLVPVGLSSDRSYAEIPVSGSTDPAAWAFVAIASIAAVVAWRSRRTDPLVGAAVGGYGILFFLTSNVPLVIGTIMGERLAYGPSLMFCALAGHAAARAVPWVGGRVVAATVIAITLVFCALTVARNATWREIGVHVETQAATAPRSAKAQLNLAVHRYHQGDMARARAGCERALEIYPGHAEAWNRLGLVRVEMGDLPGAVEAYREALRIHPGLAAAWSNLGAAYIALSDPAAALDAYRRAIALDADSARYHYQLGQAYQTAGRSAEAETAYRRAIELDAGYAPPYVNLGTLAARRGSLGEARALWERALALDPGYELARQNLQQLRALEGGE